MDRVKFKLQDRVAFDTDYGMHGFGTVIGIENDGELLYIWGDDGYTRHLWGESVLLVERGKDGNTE